MSPHSDRRPSCTAKRSSIRPKRRSAITGSTPPTSVSASSPPGSALDRVKVEVSRFNGREPDQHRWNIETGPLDSTSLRLSWNPRRRSRSRQAGRNLRIPSSSSPASTRSACRQACSTRDEIAPGWKLAGTLAWGRKIAIDHKRRRLCRRSVAQASRLDFVRPRRSDREPRAASPAGMPRPTASANSHWARSGTFASPISSLGAGGLVAVNFVAAAAAAALRRQQSNRRDGLRPAQAGVGLRAFRCAKCR